MRLVGKNHNKSFLMLAPKENYISYSTCNRLSFQKLQTTFAQCVDHNVSDIVFLLISKLMIPSILLPISVQHETDHWITQRMACLHTVPQEIVEDLGKNWCNENGCLWWNGLHPGGSWMHERRRVVSIRIARRRMTRILSCPKKPPRKHTKVATSIFSLTPRDSKRITFQMKFWPRKWPRNRLNGALSFGFTRKIPSLLSLSSFSVRTHTKMQVRFTLLYQVPTSTTTVTSLIVNLCLSLSFRCWMLAFESPVRQERVSEELSILSAEKTLVNRLHIISLSAEKKDTRCKLLVIPSRLTTPVWKMKRTEGSLIFWRASFSESEGAKREKQTHTHPRTTHPCLNWRPRTFRHLVEWMYLDLARGQIEIKLVNCSKKTEGPSPFLVQHERTVPTIP